MKVSKALFCSLSIIAFLFGPLQVREAQALSCIATFPRIGTLEEIREGIDRKQELHMKWVYTFKPTRINEGEGVVIDIDKYQELVREYIDDELDLFENAQEVVSEGSGWDFRRLVLPPEAGTHMLFEAGDIIVEGPPFELCDYRFRAVFNEAGQLKYAYVSDNYNSYQFRGTQMSFEPGKAQQCMGYGCRVLVTARVDGHRLTLEAGQSQTFESTVLNSIVLIEAHAPESGIDATRFFPWGGGKNLSYIASFHQLSNQAPSDQNTAGEEVPAEEIIEESPAQGSIESSEEKSENIFRRFWQWLRGLFSGAEEGQTVESEEQQE